MIPLIKFIIVFATCGLLAGTVAGAESGEAIPHVSLGGVDYSNVVIQSTSAKAITFSHARGMASVNRQKLKFEDLVALGLAAPPPTNSVGSTNSPESEKLGTVERFRKKLGAPQDVQKSLRDAGVSLKTLGLGTVVLYLFFSFCLLMICSKVGQPSPLLVFIPIIQILPAYRAAKMSPNWFRLLMVYVALLVTMGVLSYTGHIDRLPQPVAIVMAAALAVLVLIQMIGGIIWCFKICIAREKSPLIGIFLLLPCTQFLALAYLAFSE